MHYLLSNVARNSNLVLVYVVYTAKRYSKIIYRTDTSQGLRPAHPIIHLYPRFDARGGMR